MKAAAAALTALEPFRAIENNQASVSQENNSHRARLLRARILVALGRNEEALRWAQSVHAGLQDFNPEMLPDVRESRASGAVRQTGVSGS